MGLALAYPDIHTKTAPTVAWAGLLVVLAVYRTFRPLDVGTGFRALAPVLLELAAVVAAVLGTGGWTSSFLFSIVTPVIAAGLGAGFLPALALSTLGVLAVSASDLTSSGTLNRVSGQWVGEIVLVALVSGYARRILGEGERERSLAMDRIGQLADANALLFSLHRVAQTLPASLDLDEALDSTMSRLRDLFDCEAVAVLVLDDTDGSWLVARRSGVRPPPRLTSEDLPRPLQRALALRTLVLEPNLLVSGGPGLAPRLTSGMYAVLPARGSIIGLISVEHSRADHFRERDAELLQGFVEPAALAIDNARWFGRLRTVGAEEERNRIARDLHDRIGQSLAYLGFELDRIVKDGDRGGDVLPALDQLRDDVRTVVREVRDTLYDLRTDVSDEQGFLATLELFIGRVRDRTTFAITVRSDEQSRLPVPQERELFRIAQEALVNAERHANASHVTITWFSDGRSGRLDIADDGDGFPVGRAGRLDSYGLVGMRERAAAIGARLEIESTPGNGTRIRIDIPGGRRRPT